MNYIIGIICKNYNNCIGYKNTNKLIFNISDELKNFRKITSETTSTHKKNILLMGKNTWLSLPTPILPNRVSCVITSNYLEYSKIYMNTPDILFFGGIPQFLDYFKNNNTKYNNIFVIGGTSMYQYFYDNGLYNYLYISQITSPNNFGDVDINFKNIENEYECIHSEYYKNVLSKHTLDNQDYYLDYNFSVYKNNNKQEFKFLN